MDSVLTVVNDDLRANRHSKRLAAVKQGIAHLCILILLFFVVVPIYFLIVKSLKSPEQETMHPFPAHLGKLQPCLALCKGLYSQYRRDSPLSDVRRSACMFMRLLCLCALQISL